MSQVSFRYGRCALANFAADDAVRRAHAGFANADRRKISLYRPLRRAPPLSERDDQKLPARTNLDEDDMPADA